MEIINKAMVIARKNAIFGLKTYFRFGIMVAKVIRLIESEEILENALTKAAQVFISEEDCAELSQCRKVYPN